MKLFLISYYFFFVLYFDYFFPRQKKPLTLIDSIFSGAQAGHVASIETSENRNRHRVAFSHIFEKVN